MKRNVKRTAAVLLVLAMLLSCAGCARNTMDTAGEHSVVLNGITQNKNLMVQNQEGEETAQDDSDQVQQNPAEELQQNPLPIEDDRESLEDIVEILGGGNTSDLTDEELGDLAEDLLENLENQPDVSGGESSNPGVNSGDHQEDYNEEGELEKPFDQIYPGLVENGEVEYDEETLLVKLPNSAGGAISEGMKAAGIAAGMDSTHFAPNDPCTRGQIVTFMWRASGKPKAAILNPFVDVPGDSYYLDAILWVVQEGITTGIDAEHFAPNDACNRAQIVTFLHRMSLAV